MVIALFLSLFLATFNEPGDMHAVIIMMFFMMLLYAIMLHVSMDSIRNWISDIKLRSYIREVIYALINKDCIIGTMV